MPQTWIITDTHFNHDRMIELCGRPANFRDLIIENWKAMVGPEDMVFHLGDVIFSRAAEISGIMAGLPGRKILVRGNHDMERTQWYLKRGFDFVCYGFAYKNVYFSHKPAMT